MEVRVWRFEVGGPMLEVRGWRSEARGLEVGGPKLAVHVGERIDRHNEDMAIRSHDIINPCEQKLKPIPGKGRHKVWLPQAVLRACWGHRRRPGRTKSGTAAGITSVRAVANAFQANHSYIQRLRDSVAELYLRMQLAVLGKLEKAKALHFELAIDETEQLLRAKDGVAPSAAIGNVLCCNGKLPASSLL